jgi:predicted membrane chloride channel (bestrophin family)
MTLLLIEINNVVGSCERIVRSPVPVVYSRHTSRFLSIFCFSLPFLLLPSMGLLTIPVVTFFSWALYSIEEIGHAIENPFDPAWIDELLRAETIADLIEADVQCILLYTPPQK